MTNNHRPSHTRVLFPGGAAAFKNKKGYAAAGRIVYDIAKQMNDNNLYMPLFGTCLGFELLLYISTGDFRESCSAQRISLKLSFSNGKIKTFFR